MDETAPRTPFGHVSRTEALGGAAGAAVGVLLGGVFLAGWTVFVSPAFDSPPSEAAPLAWPALVLLGATVGISARAVGRWFVSGAARVARRLPQPVKSVIPAATGAVLLGLVSGYFGLSAVAPMQEDVRLGHTISATGVFLRFLAAGVIAGASLGRIFGLRWSCARYSRAVALLIPSRPWRRSRRVWIAAALLLLIAYPLSSGPLSYLAGAGLLPGFNGTAPWPPAVYFYGPLHLLPESPPKRLLRSYDRWAYELGRRHAAPG